MPFTTPLAPESGLVGGAGGILFLGTRFALLMEQFNLRRFYSLPAPDSWSLDDQDGFASTNWHLCGLTHRFSNLCNRFAVRVPVEPGQLRIALVSGRSVVVRVLNPWPHQKGQWFCQEEASRNYLLVENEAIGEVVGHESPAGQ